MVPGVELSDIKWIPILIAIVMNVVLGMLWYAPKVPTGRIWMREMKFPAGHKPTPKQMAVGMTLMVVGALLLFFVLMHTFVAYRDAYQKDEATYELTLTDGLMGGFFVWLGFIVPLHFASVAWEGKSWSLFFVNVSYYLVTLLAAGAIFVLMM